MISLGSKVRDKISGFEGITTARYEYLNGCVRIEVQPRVNDKGEYVDAKIFDYQQLEVLAEAPVQTGDKRSERLGSMTTGGPQLSLPIKR